MSTLDRRAALRYGLGAAAVGGWAGVAPAQPTGFTPLALNAYGRQQLVPQVDRLDGHEQAALEAFAGGSPGLLGELERVEAGLVGLRGDPGLDLALSQRTGFRTECEAVLRADAALVQVVRRQRLCSAGQFYPVVRQIDFFVSHWYPCNELQDIALCQTKLWGLVSAPAPNFAAVMAYSHHVEYEFRGMFQFHPAGGEFARHSTALLASEELMFRAAGAGDAGGCRGLFRRFAREVAAFCRVYFRRWCG